MRRFLRTCGKWVSSAGYQRSASGDYNTTHNMRRKGQTSNTDLEIAVSWAITQVSMHNFKSSIYRCPWPKYDAMSFHFK